MSFSWIPVAPMKSKDACFFSITNQIKNVICMFKASLKMCQHRILLASLYVLLYVMFSCCLFFCHFPCGVLGRVWCLIVHIPDICLLHYFGCFRSKRMNITSISQQTILIKGSRVRSRPGYILSWRLIMK